MIGAAVAAYFIFSKNSLSTDDAPLSGGESGGFPTTIKGEVITTKQNKTYTYTPATVAVSSTGKNLGVATASKAVLTAINTQATADSKTNTTRYYSDYGIVTSGGQGYSTAFPEKYVNKNTTTTASTKSPFINLQKSYF